MPDLDELQVWKNRAAHLENSLNIKKKVHQEDTRMLEERLYKAEADKNFINTALAFYCFFLGFSLCVILVILLKQFKTEISVNMLTDVEKEKEHVQDTAKTL